MRLCCYSLTSPYSPGIARPAHLQIKPEALHVALVRVDVVIGHRIVERLDLRGNDTRQ